MSTEPEMPEWIDLAADIRRVDGNHDMGAGALAAALTARGWTRRAAPAAPAAPAIEAEEAALAALRDLKDAVEIAVHLSWTGSDGEVWDDVPVTLPFVPVVGDRLVVAGLAGPVVRRTMDREGMTVYIAIEDPECDLDFRRFIAGEFDAFALGMPANWVPE